MTEFKAGDRVEYGLQGPVLQHHGKKGTVSHIATKGGWIMVDFDCGDQQIQCSKTSLVKLRERTNRDVKPLLERGVATDADEALEELVKLIPENRKGEADKHVRMLNHAIAGYGQLKSAIRTLRAQAEHAANADKGAVMAMKSIHTEDIDTKVK